MATNGHDHLELVVLPPDNLDMSITEGNNNNNNNNNNNTNHVFRVWDYLLNALFYSATSVYEKIKLSYLLRLLEFFFLSKAVLSFLILAYAHVRLLQVQNNCLDFIKDTWPRDGILRVEIIRSSQSSHTEQTNAFNELFTLENSYKREYKLKRMDKSEETAALFNRFTKTNSPENKGEVDIEPSTEELVDNTFRETNTPKLNLFSYLSFKSYIHFEDKKKEMFGDTTKTNCHTTSKYNFSIVEDSAEFCSTKYPNSSIRGVLGIDSSHQSTSTKLPLIDDHELIFYENYIVEYSLERGFLLMSPSARNRLGIPVMLVGLEWTRNKDFGNSVDQFFLDYFLDYNDFLISSVKSLAENQQNKGILRNVITEEYYRFVSIWTDRMLYITSFFIMVIFTVIISMLLKYSHNQMVFMENLMHRLIVNHSLSFSAAAPRLIIVLLILTSTWALMLAIMLVFFNDIKMPYCIITIVWVADKYHTKFSRCPITKRHWLKFFYLYHFSFYAYSYRFSGQNNNLALFCSWSFIEHSMIYFYYHYELPYALQQVQPQ